MGRGSCGKVWLVYIWRVSLHVNPEVSDATFEKFQTSAGATATFMPSESVYAHGCSARSPRSLNTL